MTTQIRSHIEH